MNAASTSTAPILCPASSMSTPPSLCHVVPEPPEPPAALGCPRQRHTVDTASNWKGPAKKLAKSIKMRPTSMYGSTRFCPSGTPAIEPGTMKRGSGVSGSTSCLATEASFMHLLPSTGSGSQASRLGVRRSSLRSSTSAWVDVAVSLQKPQTRWVRFKRWAVPHCRTCAKSKLFQTTMLVALLFALFLPDLWILLDRSTNVDLDIILTFVLVLFLVELGIQSIGLSRSYWGSGFFWMDLVGAFSVLLDLHYVRGADNMYSGVVVMRAARIAKLGARAGRFSKLVKMLRFLPGFSEKGANIGTAKMISTRVTTMLSMRIACLIITMVIVTPFFGMFSYPESDWSTTAWLGILDDFSTVEGDEFRRQLLLFVDFYEGRGYRPYQIEAKSSSKLPESTRIALLSVGSRLRSQSTTPSRADNIVSFETDNLKCHFDFTVPTQMTALMNTVLMVFIISLMIGFSLILTNSVSALVLRPLENLLLQVRTMSDTIFQSVLSLATAEEDRGADVAETEDDDRKCSKEQVFGSELKLLEKVLGKLVLFSDLSRPGIDAATMAGMGEGDRNLLNTLVGGTNEEERAGDTYDTENNDELDNPEDLLQAQNAMIDNVGLSVELLNCWRINPLELDKARNRAAVIYFLGPHNHGVKFDPVEMGNFLSTAEAGYIKTVSYHNWFHAVDVTHCTYRLLRLCGADQFLSSLERYAMLVSATCHDVGHPGLNNVYLVEACHHLALLYNDKSPLENMHCARMFEIANSPKCHIFANLSQSQYHEVRKQCIDVILYTDNIHHFPLLKEVQMLFEMHSPTLESARCMFGKDAEFPGKEAVELFKQPDARRLLMRLLLHLADISNCCKPFRICQLWATKVLEEFFTQGDQERDVGIPVQALNDREKVNRPFSQVGFIEFLVSPMFFAVIKVLPPLVLITEQMVLNTKTWHQIWLKETRPEPSETERSALAERIHKLEMRYKESLLL